MDRQEDKKYMNTEVEISWHRGALFCSKRQMTNLGRGLHQSHRLGSFCVFYYSPLGEGTRHSRTHSVKGQAAPLVENNSTRVVIIDYNCEFTRLC